MQHTRVLGTIGLVAATALGAFGPGATSHAATSTPTSTTIQRVSPAVAAARLQTALKKGYMTTAHGKRVPLSSALGNFILSGTTHKTASKASASGHADASLPGRTLNNVTQANQDFGYYATGNGQLFHNTESVAVDPLNASHVVVGATDSRAGAAGASFNFSSNPSASPTTNGTNTGCFFAQERVQDQGNLSCDLIEALGGPGIYNSIDGGSNFSDQIIPDMLTGAVPDAIVNLVIINNGLGVADLKANQVSATAAITGTQVGCLSATIVGTTTLNVPGSANGCTPYDAVGDQSVAFDAAGNLYSSSLGIVSNPPYGTGVGLTPQTDIVVNVSPAVQPIGAAALQAATNSFNNGPALITPPMAAGRFFNAPAASPSCNTFQPSTQLCLHNEVVASNSPFNYIATSTVTSTTTFTGTTGITGGVSLTATIVGRNFQADANNPAAGALGPGLCGFVGGLNGSTGDLCLIDSPYLAIDAVHNVAYITYTVLDFDQATSNIYLFSSNGLASPGAGYLPSWNPPVPVDLGVGTDFSNGFCTNAVALNGICTASWGAEPAIGPDGTLYIAYENGDLAPGVSLDNQILVAWQFYNGILPVRGTAQASATVLDHDIYTNYACSLVTPPVALSTTCDSSNFAGLDNESGAYFTIPNRPSLAVTGATAAHPYGSVIVAFTSQGGVAAAGDPTAAATTLGTRIESVTLNPTAKTPTGFTTFTALPAVDVYPQITRVNQFFPWVSASQTIFQGSIAKVTSDAAFVGFYQETPGAVTISPDSSISTSTARLSFFAARSTDGGATYGITPLDNGMPLPNPPASAAYGDYLVGGAPFFSVTGAPLSEFAGMNSVPYFGTYTGAAWDNGNGAYLTWTSTKPNQHDFGVSGSQNVELTHVG